MKRRNLIISLFALLLIACAVITPAVAYFTDNTNASGATPLYFYREERIEEKVVGLKKSVRIQNTGGAHPELADPVWIRAKAAVGQTYVQYLTVSGTGWSGPDSEGWYYYYKPIMPPRDGNPGEYTNYLDVSMEGLPKPEDMSDFHISSFGIAVTFESTTAFYDEDGVHFLDADWSATLDTGSTSPSNP